MSNFNIKRREINIRITRLWSVPRQKHSFGSDTDSLKFYKEEQGILN